MLNFLDLNDETKTPDHLTQESVCLQDPILTLNTFKNEVSKKKGGIKLTNHNLLKCPNLTVMYSFNCKSFQIVTLICLSF